MTVVHWAAVPLGHPLVAVWAGGDPYWPVSVARPSRTAAYGHLPRPRPNLSDRWRAGRGQRREVLGGRGSCWLGNMKGTTEAEGEGPGTIDPPPQGV